MHVVYLLFFYCLTAWPQTSPQIKVMPAPKSMEDYEHQNKGCPENSECDQIMGLQMQRWKDLITKLEDGEMANDKKAKFLELFRSKYGIPVEFYTNKKSQLGFRPLYFNSHCKDHNPREQEKRILRGIAFIKSLSQEKAVVWRDQTQIEVPVGELVTPQPVTAYYADAPVQYLLPLGDQPLFIKNKELFVLKEEDGFFYFLSISAKGEWKVENVDFTKLSAWEDKRENVTCPVDKKKTVSPTFGVEFCKSIWDEDLKKAVVVKMHQGCST